MARPGSVRGGAMKFLSMLPIMLLTVLAPMPTNQLNETSYEAMARRIVTALKPDRGERVILRLDPETMPALEPKVRRLLEEAGAVVETLPYGDSQDFEQKL